MPTQLGQANLSNGDAIYVDLNNDGIITAEDQHAIGFPIIRNNFSLNTSFTYKKFDFSMLWNGATNVGRALSWPYNLNLVSSTIKGWSAGFTKLMDTRDSCHSNSSAFDTNEVNNTPLSSVWLMDASYIRLATLRLGIHLTNLNYLQQIAV